MRIALDAMGGDKAPGPIVAGAARAVAEVADLHVVLVGDAARIEDALPADADRTRLEIFPATQVVGMDESPVEAMRKKPDNSIVRAWQLLAEKKVDGVVGAGNTGAMVAGGLRLKRFLKNVQRPGIATLMPTAKGYCLILDVGANIHPKPAHLYSYGVMGAIYAQKVMGIAEPRVGLMNVGEEEGKGHDLAQQTEALFRASALRERFIGNIEGGDIHKGAADVVITDGFTGNVILKLCEGVFGFIMGMVGREIVAPLGAEKLAAQANFQALAARYDYSTFGGAPLLGIDGVCVICHGSSGASAIANALRVAAQLVDSGVNAEIERQLATVV